MVCSILRTAGVVSRIRSLVSSELSNWARLTSMRALSSRITDRATVGLRSRSLSDGVVPRQLRDDPHPLRRRDALGDLRSFEQAGGHLGGDLVVAGQVSDGLDLL